MSYYIRYFLRTAFAALALVVGLLVSACSESTSSFDKAYYSGNYTINTGYTRTIFSSSNF